MADEKVTSMGAVTPTATDLVHLVTGVSTTPDNNKAALSALLKNITITPAEISAGITPTDLRYDPGNTLRYPNGLADALTVAQDAAAVGEKSILFAADETISTGLTIASGKSDISVRPLNGSRLTYTGTGTAMKIGDGSAITYRTHWSVRILRSGQDWDDGTDTTSIGLEVVGCRYSDIWAHIEGFNWGFASYSDTIGTVHNTFRIGEILDCRIGVMIDRNSDGWNNSNIYHTSIITYRTGTTSTAQTNSIVTKHVYQGHVSDNENTFIGVAFEFSVSAALPANSVVMEFNGGNNRFFAGRFEVDEANFTQLVKFGGSSINNKLEFGRFDSETTLLTTLISDSGTHNSVLNANYVYRYGAGIMLDAGIIRATGNPESGIPIEDPFDANLIAGPNTNSHADKVFAGIGSGDAIVYGLTGTGRAGIGKDPVANLGFFQFIDLGQSDKTQSVNFATFIDTTTNATASNTNFDSVTIPEDSTTLVEIDFVMRYDDGTKVWTQKRTGCISRNGSSAAVLETDTALVTHDPDTFPGSAEIRVASSQLQARVTGVAATTIKWTGFIKWQSVIAAS